MKGTGSRDEYDRIEQAVHRFMWAEKKKFTQVLTEHQLTLPQFIVLVAIKRRGAGCPIGLIAEETFQSYPTMTGIVDRLEEAGLVVRERVDRSDRRKVVVDLTPQGRQLLDRARLARDGRMRRALARFTANDRRELLRLLTAYLASLEGES